MSQAPAHHDPSASPVRRSELDGPLAARTFRGRSVEELVDRIRRELGADAIVVRRRDGLTGGIAGFFQRPFVELDAIAGSPRLDVYDEPPPRAERVGPPVGRVAPAAERVAPAAAPLGAPVASEPAPERHVDSEPASERPAAGEPAFDDPATTPGHPAPVRTPFYRRVPTVGGDSSHWESSTYVSEQLAALARAAPPRVERLYGAHADNAGREQGPPFAEMLARASGHEPSRAADAPAGSAAWRPAMVEPSVEPSVEPPIEPSTARSPTADLPTTESPTAIAAEAARRGRSHAGAGASIRSRLEALGVGSEFAEELIDGAAAHILPLAPGAGLAQAVRAALVQRIPVAPPLPSRGAAVVLVGSGGAGKTSCCAALLAAYRRSGPLPASCATVIRAGERGRFELLLSPHVLRPLPFDSPRVASVLRKSRGAGLLAIDTPSLSPHDRTGIRRLGRQLAALEPERVVLALPTTIGAVAAAQLLQALRPLGANALALTHTDETDQIGTAVEVACRFELAPEYRLERTRTGGWRMIRLDPSSLAERLLG